MPCLLKPASRVDVRGVGVQPEVMALRVAIEVETHPVTTHLAAGTEEKERAMETCCCPWMSITLPTPPHQLSKGHFGKPRVNHRPVPKLGGTNQSQRVSSTEQGQCKATTSQPKEGMFRLVY